MGKRSQRDLGQIIYQAELSSNSLLPAKLVFFTSTAMGRGLPANVFPFNSAGNPSFTFETWFKTSVSGVIIGQYVNGNPPTANTPGIYVGTDGKLHVQMFKDATGSIHPISSSSAVNDDFFHHVAVILRRHAGDRLSRRHRLESTLMCKRPHPQLRIPSRVGHTQGWPWPTCLFLLQWP